jgi:hypothetical protein
VQQSSNENISDDVWKLDENSWVQEEHSHKLRLRGGGIDKHWVNPTMNARYSEEASFDTHTTQLILKFVCYYLPTICAKLLKQR